jgi:hypothetical protein
MGNGDFKMINLLYLAPPCAIAALAFTIVCIWLARKMRNAPHLDSRGNVIEPPPQYEVDLAESAIRMQKKVKPMRDDDLRLATEEYYDDYGREALEWNEE